MTTPKFRDPEWWAKTWSKYLESYLSATPRTGIWLQHRFTLRGLSILEIASGSSRNSKYLYDLGYNVIASDFDEKTISYLTKRYSGSGFQILKEDAFNLSFSDNYFDITFHNGFWIYFQDDQDIVHLLKEQVRVTKRFIVAIVHNVENQALVNQFAQKLKTDDLYRIRFFQRPELLRLVTQANVRCKKVWLEKFGGPVDLLYSLERRVTKISKLIRWLVPRFYRLQPWTKIERIALVVELDKQ